MIELCDGDEEKVKTIISTKDNVEKYSFFAMSQKLGIVYGKNDLSFKDFVLFSLIKDAIENG